MGGRPYGIRHKFTVSGVCRSGQGQLACLKYVCGKRRDVKYCVCECGMKSQRIKISRNAKVYFNLQAFSKAFSNREGEYAKCGRK